MAGTQLRDWGFKDASGTPLKVDGMYGPKTDAVTNGFENSFLDGFTEGKNQKKTVQTKTFPTMQKMNNTQIFKNIGVTDPEATQKGANGNWIQVAKPGTWNGSGDMGRAAGASENLIALPEKTDKYSVSPLSSVSGSTASTRNGQQNTTPGAGKNNSLEGLQKEYVQTQQDLLKLQKQADALDKLEKYYFQRVQDTAEKVRNGEIPESEYQALWNQWDSYEKQAEIANNSLHTLKDKKDTSLARFATESYAFQTNADELQKTYDQEQQNLQTVQKQADALDKMSKYYFQRVQDTAEKVRSGEIPESEYQALWNQWDSYEKQAKTARQAEEKISRSARQTEERLQEKLDDISLGKLLQSEEFDITAVENAGARRALQKVFNMEDADDDNLDKLQNTIQDDMTAMKRQYSQTMTSDDLKAVMEWEFIKQLQGPHISPGMAKAIEKAAEFWAEPSEAIYNMIIEGATNAANLIGR